MKSIERIWIVEDDPDSIFVYREILESRYNIRIFVSLDSFQKALRTILDSNDLGKPHLIIADLGLPDGNFLDLFCDKKASLLSELAFLVVSSCDDLEILRSCFTFGALDYLTKPFTKAELIVKTERLLNHRRLELVIDTTHSLGQLTARELQIFSVLNRNIGKPIHRKDLTDLVWKNVFVSPKTLDVHLFNLRKKLLKFNLAVRFFPPDSYILLSNGMDPEVGITSARGI